MAKYALIQGMAVDLTAILSLVHRCQPELCRTTNCCCATYDVEISLEELTNINGYLPVAAAFGNGGSNGSRTGNLFQDLGRNLFLIETHEDELCRLAYRGENGQPFCSLHAAALSLHLPPAAIKPKCCLLWPLALEEGDIPVLGVHSDAFNFPCNVKGRSLPGNWTRAWPGFWMKCGAPASGKRYKGRFINCLDE
jgi:hypothetical protein